MLAGIIIAFVIPIVAGLMLWYTDWAESAVLAAVPNPATDPQDARSP